MMQALAIADVAEWAAPLDMDEFVYGFRQPMSEVVAKLGTKGVDQICVPWIMFGSGGRDKQRTCIRPNYPTHNL
jgi:hypothetical protein